MKSYSGWSCTITQVLIGGNSTVRYRVKSISAVYGTSIGVMATVAYNHNV